MVYSGAPCSEGRNSIHVAMALTILLPRGELRRHRKTQVKLNYFACCRLLFAWKSYWVPFLLDRRGRKSRYRATPGGGSIAKFSPSQKPKLTSLTPGVGG